MKTKKFATSFNADGVQIDTKEITISDKRFREIVGIDPGAIVSPYSYRISGSSKAKLLLEMWYSADYASTVYFVNLEWKEVPESEGERSDIIKKYIRKARQFFPASDDDVSNWLKLNCECEWSFNKYMTENSLLLAIEELHVMVQCFYASPLHDQNISRNLVEARKLISQG